LDSRKAAVPIGYPIHNTQLYVLNDALQTLPMGVSGELYIGGAGLARGYLGRDDLTAERFIENPFGAGRLYKTGDVVRRLDDGCLEYLGRNDDQVKVRGFRIELGEIEACLQQHSAVHQAVVVATEEHQALVAYVVADADGDDSLKSQLRTYLEGQLPHYMLPQQVIVLRTMPLTMNGRLDHQALPEPEVDIVDHRYEPMTKTQRHLVSLWSQLLDRAPATINVDSNYFELGGHSLLVARLAQRIREECTGSNSLGLHHLFSAQTIRAQAKLIDNGLHTHFEALEQLGTEDRTLPTLYFIPGAAGLANSFIGLAAAARGKFNVKSFNHQGLIDGKEPFSSLEENADFFATTILNQTIDHSLIVVVGHSYGGVVALETVKQLRERGYNTHLVMLDCYFKQHLLSLKEEGIGKGEVRELETPLVQLESPLRENVSEVLDRQLTFFEHYSPSNVADLDTLFVFARETVFDINDYMNKVHATFDAHTQYHIVSGDHFSMLKGQGAEEICAVLVKRVHR
jgi:thioesterase domain-containing protein/aryl carrier-like protein